MDKLKAERAILTLPRTVVRSMEIQASNRRMWIVLGTKPSLAESYPAAAAQVQKWSRSQFRNESARHQDVTQKGNGQVKPSAPKTSKI